MFLFFIIQVQCVSSSTTSCFLRLLSLPPCPSLLICFFVSPSPFLTPAPHPHYNPSTTPDPELNLTLPSFSQICSKPSGAALNYPLSPLHLLALLTRRGLKTRDNINLQDWWTEFNYPPVLSCTCMNKNMSVIFC